MRFYPLAAAALMSFATFAHADVVYNVSLDNGYETAIGTITTDGVTGVVGQGDVLDYTFTVSNGVQMETYGAAGGFLLVLGDALTATPTGLFYDYPSTDFAGDIFGDSTGYNYVCLVTQGASCSGYAASIEISIDGYYTDGDYLSEAQQIGTVVTAPTPEPSSLFLLGTGVVGLAGAARRRFLK